MRRFIVGGCLLFAACTDRKEAITQKIKQYRDSIQVLSTASKLHQLTEEKLILDSFRRNKNFDAQKALKETKVSSANERQLAIKRMKRSIDSLKVELKKY